MPFPPSHVHFTCIVNGFLLFVLDIALCYISSSSSSSSVICQTTGPKPLPKRFIHIVRSRASSFNWQYPLLSLRSSSIFLRLLPRLLVTSICPFIFRSITCCRRQFLRKMWPIQLAFRFVFYIYIYIVQNIYQLLSKWIITHVINIINARVKIISSCNITYEDGTDIMFRNVGI